MDYDCHRPGVKPLEPEIKSEASDLDCCSTDQSPIIRLKLNFAFNLEIKVNLWHLLW